MKNDRYRSKDPGFGCSHQWARGEVRHFEAKCFFLKKGESAVVWPQGSNSVINIEPADTCCGNIIYNDIVR
jgi:hypothetical protein